MHDAQPERDCHEFERLLQAAVEERAPLEQPALRDHAARCDECGLLWEQTRLLEQALPLWKSRLPSPDLADKVLAQLRDETCAPHASRQQPAPLGAAATAAEPAPPSHPTWVPAAAVAIAALGLLLLVWPLARTDVPRGANPDSPLAAVSPASPTDPAAATRVAPAPVEAPLPLDVAVRDAADAWRTLAQETRDALSHARFLLPTRGLLLAEAAPDDAPAIGTDGRADDLEREFGPIRHGLQETIDFLLETMSQDAPAT